MPEFNPPPPGRYIDPLVDFAFKKIFGNLNVLDHVVNEGFERGIEQGEYNMTLTIVREIKKLKKLQ